MLKSLFAEDVFSTFYLLVDTGAVSVQSQDFMPIMSFHSKIVDGSQLTKNQANYILKLLEKYKNLSAAAGFDYRHDLSALQWKTSFRVLDLSKKIYVEKKDNGSLEICLKFPYQLKKEFDEEINVNSPDSNRVSHWDHEDKVRRLKFYEFNLVSLYEFASKHNFEIDETFMDALAEVEEIWQDSENSTPRSELAGHTVILVNANEDAHAYFESHRSGSILDDALLAKSMGYPFARKDDSPMGKLVSSQENSFWVKDNVSFFNIYKELVGKVCIVLDRTSNTLAWLQKFVTDADENKISREEIKVCFRDSKESNLGLNDWIKLAGVGGKVETGRILIFESKPAKWLFKEQENVKIVVTNNIYPPTNTITREWFYSHPCVLFLGDTRPTEQRGKKIVEL